MTVKVRFFASLSEQLGFSQHNLEYRSALTIDDIWREVTNEPPPPNLLCALNHEYSKFDQKVNEGDEVAFFPPVNGG